MAAQAQRVVQETLSTCEVEPKSAIPVGFMQRLYIAVDTMAEEIGYSYVVSASLTLRLSMRRLTSMAVRGRERSGKTDCCSI
jgi:hypothetical protein